MLDRRSFFRILAGGAVAVTFVALDPERALWMPGKKLISIPRPRIDSRFLVYVRAGKPDMYHIPEGSIRLITQKLPSFEQAVTAISVEQWMSLGGGIAGHVEAAAVAPNRYGGNGRELLIWPRPVHDTVLAIEYWPKLP